LRALGYSVLLVSPNPVAFVSASTPNPGIERAQATRLANVERTLMLNRMRQAQIQVLDWDVQMPFESAVHKSLSRNFPGTQIIGSNL